jgi:hypothetical protein
MWLRHAVMASIVELDHSLAVNGRNELRIHVCPSMRSKAVVARLGPEPDGAP